MKKFMTVATLLLSGCTDEPPPQVVSEPSAQVAGQSASTQSAGQSEAMQSSSSSEVYQTPPPQPVSSVYIDPPLSQPPPVSIGWAPPPMLVDPPLPPPNDGDIWTGGYWTWEGNWVWAHGMWAPPPQVGYNWNNPYYENRGGSVVFVNGFWAAPGISFVAPPMSLNIAIGEIGVGIIPGPSVIGPVGVFIPPPPGSVFGLIVPAPIGTAPAVVMSAPPIIREGMRVTSNNGHNVTVVALAHAMANGQAFNATIPAKAHLAAALPPVVKALAPEPAFRKPIPAYAPGRPLVTLPPAQMVHSVVSSALMQHQSAEQAAKGQVAPESAAKSAEHPVNGDEIKSSQDLPKKSEERKIEEGKSEEHKAEEHKAVVSKSAEHKPEEHKAVAPKPAEHRPEEHKAAALKPAEHRPEEHKAAAPKPAERRPEEHKAAAPKPAEHRPEEHKAAVPKPEEHKAK